jgi:predicted Fe-Mo cluster-binding NifX family protein
MKTAITVWNNRVSPVFDVANQALLFDLDGHRITSEHFLILPHSCTAEKILWLQDAKTEVLICGAISREAHANANNAGIRVYPFIAGDILKVLQAYLAGKLVAGGFAMPGCACRMGCSGRMKHAQRRERVTGSALICNKQEPDKKGV